VTSLIYTIFRSDNSHWFVPGYPSMTSVHAGFARFRFLLPALFFMFMVGEAAAAAQVSKYHALQQQADALYAKGEYQQAMKQYLSLAKKGDTFSQYRVSYMYLEGQGTESDLIESFAWAFLSAQNYQKDLVQYRDTVSSLIPEDQQRKATRRVDYYMRKWGNRAIAQEAVDGARRELRDCTGSRLGTRCDEVYAAQMPTFWGVTPGNGSNPGGGEGGDGGSASASGSVASANGNGAGGPSQDVRYYQALRQKIRDMNQYIEETNGSVTITDMDSGTSEPAPQAEADGG